MALTDDAIDKIKQIIISGRVRPGEKLPREADLAASLGIAIGPGNSVLASLVDTMSLPTARPGLARHDRAAPSSARSTSSRAIHRAVMNRDADLARSWATVHIAGIESWLRTTLTG